MGTRGPVPKRANERAGHRAKDDRPDSVKMSGAVDQPPADPDWHVAATSWYDSLALSGQARYFEPSDWEYARVVAELLSKELSQAKQSAQMMKSILAAMGDLGTTEAARRRMSIEVERALSGTAEHDDARVAIMARYREALGG